jgi:hypothetical protein
MLDKFNVGFRGATKLCLNKTKHHQDRIYSVKSRQKPNYGRVVGWTQYLVMRQCTTSVSEKLRQRVIRDQAKNVHAHILGDVVLAGNEARDYISKLAESRLIGIGYDPYKSDRFHCIPSGWQLPKSASEVSELDVFESAKEVILFPNGSALVLEDKARQAHLLV